MSLPPLRTRLPLDSLSSLTDDSLLVILWFLSLPQLLTLLSASRRLNRLIVEYTLPHYRSILMTNESVVHLVQSFFFSRRFHRHGNISPSLSIDRLPRKAFGLEKLNQYALKSFPFHLPHLLPRLQSFAFYYFLGESENSLLSERQLVNRLLSGYLQSNWSQTVVSLEFTLVLDKAEQPLQADDGLLGQLTQLHALRHLSLFFSTPWEYFPDRILPDSMPALGQLDSFALHRYPSGNTATLLRQLSPNLTSLTLFAVACSREDFLSFLNSKPNYKQTLHTLDIHLKDERFLWWTTPQVWSLASYRFPLERLFSRSLVAGELFPFFEVLSRGFSRLRELGYLTLTIVQLRALRDGHPRISLTRLPSLRRVYLCIRSYDNALPDFQLDELFDSHLPLLGFIFCAVDHIEINLEHSPVNYDGSDWELISEKLVAKMKKHFPRASTCKGKYQTCTELPAGAPAVQVLVN